jgi:hypothetical protein
VILGEFRAYAVTEEIDGVLRRVERIYDPYYH